jgi:glycosyltransferase involved in cell wall biosynthesis
MVTLSVIIPTYNRPERLAACLDSLARQQYPRDQFEVVVVNDGGATGLEPVLEPFRLKLDISLINQPNSGPAGARNSGVKKARGEFIAFVDDDCSLAEDWLSRLTSRLHQDPARMYGGVTLNALENNVYSSASQCLIDYLYSYYNADPQDAQFLASNNMAMSRQLFEAVGGFDPGFPGACGEDREFCDRWVYCGHSISLVEDVIVFHHHHLNFRSYCRQHFNYGTGAVRFWERRAQRQQQSLHAEPWSFYIGLVSHAWKKRLRRPLSLTALMVVSQVANAAGYFRTKSVRGERQHRGGKC